MFILKQMVHVTLILGHAAMIGKTTGDGIVFDISASSVACCAGSVLTVLCFKVMFTFEKTITCRY